ncbi:MAG: hypothetical protein ACOCRK_03025 [bacterium]
MKDFRYSSSPFDCLVYNGKILLGIECKMLSERKNGEKPKSFPFDRVTDTQREGLLDIDRFESAKGLILVNFRWFSGKGKCYVLPISEFIYLEHALSEGELKNKYRNTKSIPLEYFEKCTLELHRYKRGWDLRPLLLE